MLEHEPDGTTIGVSCRQAARNLRARSTASSRNPSLNATCPQQKALFSGRTRSRSRSSTVAVASKISGKNSSARQVEKSWTSVIAWPHHDYVERLGSMHPHHDAFLDVCGAAGSGYQGQAMRFQRRAAQRG